MALFVPFRALGLVTEDAPFVTQRRGKETFITLSVGDSWQIYNASNLRLRLIGPKLKGDIKSLGCKGDLTFAAVGERIIETRRVHIQGIYRSSGGTVEEIMVLGDYIIGRTRARQVLVWSIGEYGEPVSELDLGDDFTPTCMAHPQTYLNKIVIGSSDGRMQLWNFVSEKKVYEFASLNSGVCCVVPSSALDIVGIGLRDGRAILKDLRQDKVLLEFRNAAGSGTKADRFLSKSADEVSHRSAHSPCTCIAFRTGEGLPLMATGGTTGVISVWNLESQSLHAIMRDAHDGPLTRLEFLGGQPVLVSTARDNSVKEWIFDGTDGQPRLLRYRSGHALPPTIVRHYADSTRLLSGGQDRAFRYFSAIQDAQSREMSQGHIQRRAKKLKIAEQELKLPRIISLDACDVRERDWSNVITAHEDDCVAYVWRIQKFAQGEFALLPPNVEKESLSPVSCVCLSTCGNFGFVGSSSGRIDRYNMQSGLHRGTYRCPGGFSAHSGAVTGLAADGCNRYLVSGALDGLLKCWNLKNLTLEGQVDVGSKISNIALHPTSCLVAVACDDLSIKICDVEARTIVRRYRGHSDRITDLQFSEDCRWLLTSSMDSTLRIWDVPGSTILQVLKMDSPITSLSLSPAMDILVTTHVEKRGLYTWANGLIFGTTDAIEASDTPISIKIPDMSSADIQHDKASRRDSQRSTMLQHSSMPPSHQESTPTASENSSEEIHHRVDLSDDASTSSESEVDDAMESNDTVSMNDRDAHVLTGTAPVAPDMITLSMLPRSQWLNLVHIDTIKTRNKPIEPPKKPEAAPFFLPTVAGANAGRDPVFAVPDPDSHGSDDDDDRIAQRAAAAWGDDDDTIIQEEDQQQDDAGENKDAGNKKEDDSSRVRKSKPGKNGLLLSSLLETYTQHKTWKPLLEHLTSLSPSQLDVQLRSLDLSDEGEDHETDMLNFLSFLSDAIASDTHFEFLQALLRAFILIHGESIAQYPRIQERAQFVEEQTHKAWTRLEQALQHTLCVIGILGSMQQT